MMIDNCVSWVVLTALVLIVCLRLFFYCVNRQEQNKPCEEKFIYDQDLFFF